MPRFSCSDKILLKMAILIDLYGIQAQSYKNASYKILKIV